MIEVNIRTYTEKNVNGMFPDYHEQLELLHSQMKKEVEAYINDSDCIQVYQYYSAAPLCFLEAKMLRRMNVGECVTHVNKSIDEYLGEKHIPEALNQVLRKYLLKFFNSMDIIVTTDAAVQARMEQEGVTKPHYYCIGEMNAGIKPAELLMWMEVYRQGMRELVKRQVEEKIRNQKIQYCLEGRSL